MAWYYGTFSCGHEGRVNIVGPVKDRQWKADRKFSGLCDECYTKHREEEKERKYKEAEKLAKEMELPELTGTEKQVAWAITLRQQMIEKFEKTLDMPDKDIEFAFEGKSKDDIRNVLHYLLESKTTASFYINNRFERTIDLLETYFDEASQDDDEKVVETEEAEILEELKLESTVFPENKVTNAAAEITVKDNLVSVVFEKNDDFRSVVKELGYSWNGKAWEKKIKETTGSAEERAAELGNKLLNAGFPIMILEKEIRKNAIEGNFEPECTNWIYRRKDTNRLAINWKGYDNTLYQRARSLPGSKWNSPSMLVDVAHYKEVEEFAELYGFKFTNAAKKLIDEYKRSLEKIESVQPKKNKEKEQKDGLEKILESSDEILDDLKD